MQALRGKTPHYKILEYFHLESELASYCWLTAVLSGEIITLWCHGPGRKDIWRQCTMYTPLPVFCLGCFPIVKENVCDCVFQIGWVCGWNSADPCSKLIWPWFQPAAFRRKTAGSAKHNTDTDRERTLAHLWSVWDSYFQDTEQNWKIVVKYNEKLDVFDRDPDMGAISRDHRLNSNSKRIFSSTKRCLVYYVKLNWTYN